MKIKSIAGLVALGAMAVGFTLSTAASSFSRWDNCAFECESRYFSCVLNGVGTEHQCYMDFVRCVGRCGPER